MLGLLSSPGRAAGACFGPKLEVDVSFTAALVTGLQDRGPVVSLSLLPPPALLEPILVAWAACVPSSPGSGSIPLVALLWELAPLCTFWATLKEFFHLICGLLFAFHVFF